MNTIKEKYINKYKEMSLISKATLWFMICSILQKSISLITTPIFTRLLSVEEYGQISVFNSWVQIVTLLCTLRLDYGIFYKGIIKFNTETKEYVTSMQSFSTLLALGLASIYCCCNQYINNFTEMSTAFSILLLMQVCFTISIPYWSGINRYEYKYKSVILLTMLMLISDVLLGLTMVLVSENKGDAKIFSHVIVQCIFGLIIYIINLKRCKTILNIKHIKFAVGFNIPLIPHYLSTYILDQSDRLMIQKMIGLTEAGLYSVVYNASMVLKIIGNSINNALVPWEYKMLEEKKYKEINQQLNKYMFLVTGCIILFNLFVPELLLFLAGSKYMEAIYCVPPVTASCFFIFIWGVYGNAEFFYDANKFTMYISICGAFLNLILNYILLGIFGYVAAAYTTLICYIIFTLSHFIFINSLTKRKLGEKVFEARCLVFCSLILLISIFLLVIIYNHMIIRYSLIILISIFIWIFKDKIYQIIRNKIAV